MAASGSGLNIQIDTSDLLAYAKRTEAASKATPTVIAAGVNTVGDSVLATLATSVAKQTGLGLEEVRGLIGVKRATRNDPEYELKINKRLMNEKLDTLEGQREVRDFGKRQPGELVVVVSKHDELVCMDCEELEAAGPMPVEIAMQHVPRHPHCRCIIMPYVAKGKRLPVTMTSVTGTDPDRRAGRKSVSLDTDITLRQLVQKVLSNSTQKIRIELK